MLNLKEKLTLEKGQLEASDEFFWQGLSDWSLLKSFKHQTTHRSIRFLVWEVEMSRDLLKMPKKSKKLKALSEILPDATWCQWVKKAAIPCRILSERSGRHFAGGNSAIELACDGRPY